MPSEVPDADSRLASAIGFILQAAARAREHGEESPDACSDIGLPGTSDAQS